MAGDMLATLKQRDLRLGHADIDLATRVLARHGVVPVDLDVLIDANPGDFPFSVPVAVLWKSMQGWLVHLGARAGTGYAGRLRSFRLDESASIGLLMDAHSVGFLENWGLGDLQFL